MPVDRPNDSDEITTFSHVALNVHDDRSIEIIQRTWGDVYREVGVPIAVNDIQVATLDAALGGDSAKSVLKRHADWSVGLSVFIVCLACDLGVVLGTTGMDELP